jgi:hypothetical protein
MGVVQQRVVGHVVSNREVRAFAERVAIEGDADPFGADGVDHETGGDAGRIREHVGHLAEPSYTHRRATADEH